MTPASRRKPVRMTPDASRDAQIAFAYVEERNRAAAIAVARRLRTALSRLGQFPDMGVALHTDAFDFAEPGTRVLVVEPYIVFYRVLPEAVVVLRILHARQDSLGMLFE